MWPWFAGDLGVWAGATLQGSTGYFVGFPFFILGAMVLSLNRAFALLFHQLAGQLAEARTFRRTVQIARRYGRMCDALARASALLAAPLGYALATMFGMSVVSTLLMLKGHGDSLCMPTAPFLLFIVTIFVTADRVQEAAGRLRPAAFEAFNSSLWETPDGSDPWNYHRFLKMLGLLALRAGKEQPMAVCGGTVRLNLSTLTFIVRHWYSLLGVLLKMPA